MVKTSLVEPDLIAGKRLLIALHVPPENRSSFRIKAAFWHLDLETQEWRLGIATPLVDEEGPLSTYSRLQKALFSIQPVDLSLQNINVLSPKDPLVKGFRRALRMAPGSADLKFTRSTVGGKYVEDAYVYRVPPHLL